MYRLIAGALLTGVLVLAQPAEAQANSIDFGAMSCRTFLEEVSANSEEDVAAIMLWLDGYLSGVSGDTTLRFDTLEAFGTNLVEYCAKNGNTRLLDAARKVGLS